LRLTGLDDRDAFEARDTEDEGGRLGAFNGRSGSFAIDVVRDGPFGVWSWKGSSPRASGVESRRRSGGTWRCNLLGERRLERSIGMAASPGSEDGGVGMSFQLSVDASDF
jgi:hypothetical protein